MLSLTILSLTIALTLASLAILCVVATRDSVLSPAMVNPFCTPTITDPTSETMAISSMDNTLAGDWQMVELSNLTHVEDLLDNLEIHNIRHKEVEILGNDKFVVRRR